MPEIRGRFKSFGAAVAHFRQKLNLPSERWDDIKQGEHARAFIVAGVTRDNVLTEIREAVDAALDRGETLEDFRKRWAETVARHGWPGGAGNESDKRRAWRTSVIYHTNLRTSYMAGRWETLKQFPYLKYQHNTVRHPREAHLAWDGKIIATDDPWWQTHYPPNGWGCRCTVTGVSAARLKALGKQADAAPGASDGDPPPEWSYHVGEAASGRAVDPRILEAERGGKLVSLDDRGPADFDRPDLVPFDKPVMQPFPERIKDPVELRQRYTALFGDQPTFTDPTGAPIVVNNAVLDHWLEDLKRLQGREQYLPLLQEVIEKPFEVWVGFARNELTGRVELRRRYVKGIEVGKHRILGFVADAIGGQWVSFNLISGGASGAKGMRVGRPIWARDGDY